MSKTPGQDAMEFAAGLTLGAALGWAAVVLLAGDAEPNPGRKLRDPNAGRRPALLAGVKRQARQLAAESGEELARLAVHRIRQALIGPGPRR